ncbi:MAG: hypothetical protein K2X53_00195 [Alphaproteobacteria bacterium]|nr:hypothetical protein [Alphaproteobacteria bacterium]
MLRLFIFVTISVFLGSALHTMDHPEDFLPDLHRERFNKSLLSILCTPVTAAYDPYDSPSSHLINMVYSSINLGFRSKVLTLSPTSQEEARRRAQGQSYGAYPTGSQPVMVFTPILSTVRSTVQRTTDLWTEVDQMILNEEMQKAHLSSKPPEESADPLTQCCDGVIRMIGEFFKRRTLLQDVKGLQIVSCDNKPLVKRIFDEFARSHLYREKDTKLYRDFFYEFED